MKIKKVEWEKTIFGIRLESRSKKIETLTIVKCKNVNGTSFLSVILFGLKFKLSVWAKVHNFALLFESVRFLPTFLVALDPIWQLGFWLKHHIESKWVLAVLPIPMEWGRGLILWR